MKDEMIKKRVHIVEQYFQNGENLNAAKRKMRPILNTNNVQNWTTVEKIMEKLGSTGSVVHVKYTIRARSGQIPQHFAISQHIEKV